MRERAHSMVYFLLYFSTYGKAFIVQRLSGNNDAGMEKAAKKSLIQPLLPVPDPQFG